MAIAAAIYMLVNLLRAVRMRPASKTRSDDLKYAAESRFGWRDLAQTHFAPRVLRWTYSEAACS
jgi:hypothetical protein